MSATSNYPPYLDSRPPPPLNLCHNLSVGYTSPGFAFGDSFLNMGQLLVRQGLIEWVIGGDGVSSMEGVYAEAV